MSEKLLVPDIGDFEEVEVIEILVKQGDQIKENDPVVTIESDKSSVEVPSSHSGEIKKINVKIGDKVNKGDTILTINSEVKEEKKEIVKKKQNPEEIKPQIRQSSEFEKEELINIFSQLKALLGILDIPP